MSERFFFIKWIFCFYLLFVNELIRPLTNVAVSEFDIQYLCNLQNEIT